ncbi:MAG TPA: ABC transporter ATP-binding protein [Clostridiaceae bacterium]|nr:ABC transporter ATP-binding protein [Clostridiaceae bacterium]
MEHLINMKNVEKSFNQKRGEKITILRDINLSLNTGETLCVVGESGCGKTTLGRILAGLIPYSEGSYVFENHEVSQLKGENRDNFRNHVQLIHQNPYESLNPTMMIFDIIANPIRKHRGITDTAQLYAEVTRLLDIVGLTPVSDFVDKYPSYLSGGQRQRVSIARVLAMDPKFIVVDEATSMIDTSLRISLLTTLKEIQERTRVAYFFITHDLALGRYFAQGQQIMVMYLGRIIEQARTDDFIRKPYHPYSKAILSASVGNSGLLESSSEFEKYDLEGTDIPSFRNVPTGCALHPRCPQKIPGLCDTTVPELFFVEPGHTVACHLYEEDKTLSKQQEIEDR